MHFPRLEPVALSGDKPTRSDDLTRRALRDRPKVTDGRVSAAPAPARQRFASPATYRGHHSSVPPTLGTSQDGPRARGFAQATRARKDGPCPERYQPIKSLSMALPYRMALAKSDCRLSWWLAPLHLAFLAVALRSRAPVAWCAGPPPGRNPPRQALQPSASTPALTRALESVGCSLHGLSVSERELLTGRLRLEIPPAIPPTDEGTAGCG
jgi:hypothetical protein